MPFLNSAPVGTTTEVYREYVDGTIDPRVICNVSTVQGDKPMDYGAMVDGISKFTQERARRDALELLKS